MSDTTKRVIMLAVALVLTTACISIYVYTFNNSRQQVEEISADQQQKIHDMRLYPITKYDGCIVWGTDVVVYCRTHYDELDRIFINGNELFDLSKLRDDTSLVFVDPIGTYRIEILYNTNGVPNVARITTE